MLSTQGVIEGGLELREGEALAASILSQLYMPSQGSMEWQSQKQVQDGIEAGGHVLLSALQQRAQSPGKTVLLDSLPSSRDTREMTAFRKFPKPLASYWK